jgi:ribosome-binding protein aMBF1 (putative translation factor)
MEFESQGKLLQKVLRQAGLSQVDLSMKLKTTPQYISNCVRGTSQLAPHHWKEMDNFVGCEPVVRAYMKDQGKLFLKKYYGK